MRSWRSPLPGPWRELAIATRSRVFSHCLVSVIRRPGQSAIAALNSIGHPDMASRIAARLTDPRAARSRIGDQDCPATSGIRRFRTGAAVLSRFGGIGAPGGDRKPRLLRRPACRADAGRRTPAAVAHGPRRCCCRAGSTEPSAAVDALARSLGDSDPWVRYVALRSLGSIGDGRVVPAVLTALRKDPAPHVRLAAIDVLGRLKAPEAWDVLEPLARSSDSDMGGAAIRALDISSDQGAGTRRVSSRP